MKKSAAFGSAVGLSILFCGITGLFRTREAALHLLEKNRTLLDAGRVALPGTGHLETLASWYPAFAGALFFALALGVGYGGTSFFYGQLWRRLPGWWRYGLSFPLALFPLWALYRGEYDTSLALALTGAAGIVFGLKADGWPTLDKRRALVALLSALLLAAGFLPWAFAKEGVFTRLRDTILLDSDLLRPVSDFYYRWTLYPAEAIKPVDIRTQPLAAADESLRDTFCREAWGLGIVCVPPDSKTYDFIARVEGDGVKLLSGEVAINWNPTSMEANAEAFKNFGDTLDGARVLRRSTAITLTWLLPAVLFLSLVWATLALGVKRVAPAIGAALLLAASIAYFGLPGGFHEELQDMASGKSSVDEIDLALDSPNPVKRLYGAMAAGANPSAHEERLLRALTDPVINVRYNAAVSLGKLGTTTAEKRLKAVLASDEEWYVKFRAYGALGRMGWMP